MTPDDLWRFRVAYELTQREAADWLGVTLRAWQYYEGGERPIPRTIERLVRLCERPSVRVMLRDMARDDPLAGT